jgi:hypothetical protein
MHRYQLSGHAELIAGWTRALTTAQLDAARTGEIVTIATTTRRRGRRTVGTMFPNGEFVRTKPLHLQPRGFGL